MEVVHILPTAVAIIPCPFHNDIKDTILSEVREQEESMIEFNEKNDNLKDSVLNFPRELKKLLDQKVND